MAAPMEKTPQRVTVEPGVQACHSRKCASAVGRKCNCDPTYQAWARDPRSGKRLYHRCAGGGPRLAPGRPRGAPQGHRPGSEPHDALRGR